MSSRRWCLFISWCSTFNQPRDLRSYSLVQSTRNKTPPFLFQQSSLPLMDVNNMAAIQQSIGSDSTLALILHQVKLSTEKKNKAITAKKIRAARSQLEKLLSTRSELLNQTQSQLESDAQAYLTRHAQDLDEIRGLWTAIVRRREALSELLSSEEKTANQLEIVRERDSAASLAKAKADCEEQQSNIATLDQNMPF
ncbi:hypothetical protein BGW80DRAFT_906347 [Lactifluus volemus]|nr:hypothetical protein BGW80DRAFT_906347 [Lactifluus volemus]